MILDFPSHASDSPSAYVVIHNIFASVSSQFYVSFSIRYSSWFSAVSLLLWFLLSPVVFLPTSICAYFPVFFFFLESSCTKQLAEEEKKKFCSCLNCFMPLLLYIILLKEKYIFKQQKYRRKEKVFLSICGCAWEKALGLALHQHIQSFILFLLPMCVRLSLLPQAFFSHRVSLFHWKSRKKRQHSDVMYAFSVDESRHLLLVQFRIFRYNTLIYAYVKKIFASFFH